MATSSRHRRPFPHTTVVPAFIVLASTSATATATATAASAGFQAVGRSSAFAAASAAVARSVDNRYRTTHGGTNVSGSRRSSRRRRGGSTRLHNRGSVSALELGFDSAYHPARGRGVRRRRSASIPSISPGRQRLAALFPSSSRLFASPTALPEDTNSTPRSISNRGPAQPSTSSSGVDGRVGAGGSEAERDGSAAPTSAVGYSVLCPALDGADDGLLALSIRDPSSASQQQQHQKQQQQQQSRGREQLLERAAKGASRKDPGNAVDRAVPPPPPPPPSPVEQRSRGDDLPPYSSSAPSQSSEDTSAGGRSAGSERLVLRRGGRANASDSRGTGIEGDGEAAGVGNRRAAATGPSFTTDGSAAARASRVDEAVAVAAREVVGLGVVAVGQEQGQGRGRAARSTPSPAMAARPLNAPGKFVGGGDGGGGGGGGKKATRKRRRNGATAISSAEDRALRELLLEAIKTGRGGAALRALRLMVEQGLPVSQKQYVGAMEACMQQGSWTSGLEVFRLLLEDLRPRGLSPKQSTWKSLAKGLRASGQADQGVAVLRQALKAGVRHIDEQVCSILLDLCAVKGRMGLAEEIASLMETHRIPKGPVTYCVLLKGYGRQRRLRGVDATMREMKEKGVVPDVVALNAAVDAFVRCGELSKAREILVSMERSPGGSLAQTLTYNTLIKGLGRELRVEEAFGVARGMLDRGCFPNEVTINSLVDICVRSGDLDRAYNLLKNPTIFPSSPAAPAAPGAGTPGAGGDWARAADEAAGEVGAAHIVDSPWSEAESRGGGGDAAGAAAEVGGGRQAAAAVGAGATGGYGEGEGGAWRGVGLVCPSVEAFTSVLTGFAGVGDKERALAVFQQMVTAGVEPNVVTYTGLISACVNAGDMEGARRLFSALEARGAVTPSMQPSSFTYNTLIRGLCRMAMDSEANTNTDPVPASSAASAAAAYSRDGAVGDPAPPPPPPPPPPPSSAARRNGYENQEDREDQDQEREGLDMDVGVGIFTDLDLLLPGGAAAEGDPAYSIISKPAFFYETSSPPSTATAATAAAAAEGGLRKETPSSNSRSSSSRSGAGPAKEVGGKDGGDVEGATSLGVGSSVVESPPGILTDSADSESGGGGSGALPDGIQEALRVLLSMRRRGVPADEVTMNSIIDGLVSCSPPRVREAETVLALMSGWGLKPNQVSFTVMLKGYGRIGDLGAAELMFELMANDRDQRPDVVALNSILDACVRNGDLRRAVEILEKASTAAISKRAIYTRQEDWVEASSSMRPWGANAGSGAVALCGAAAPGSGIGLGVGDDGEGEGAQGTAGTGVVMDVWPNQVSFATVVLGLSRRGDAPAGRKAIRLYESMRRDFNFLPDEGMVDSLVAACCNAQAAQVDGSDLALAQGQEALNELRDLGWDEELIAFKERVLMRVVPTLSEVWKEEEEEPLRKSRGVRNQQQQQQQQQQREGGKAGAARKRKVSAEIFEKYGWNKMESHFPIL